MINSLEHLDDKGSRLLATVNYLNYNSGVLSLSWSQEGVLAGLISLWKAALPTRRFILSAEKELSDSRWGTDMKWQLLAYDWCFYRLEDTKAWGGERGMDERESTWCWLN